MDYTLLVNKNNLLSEAYIPKDLIKTNSKYKDNIYLEKKTYEQFKLLQEEAKKYNYLIDIESGYRDYKYQEKIYNKLLKEKGFNYTLRRIAKPGSSEHQTGLAIDFCIYTNNKCYIEQEIEHRIETKWVHDNCYKYGFILRYPYDKEDITEYDYEPWHLRYVGDIAKDIYQNKLTLEEYYKLRNY